MNINIESFLKKFNQEYDFLYENYDHVAGFYEAVQSFDTFATTDKSFIMEFVNFRGDFISSDREAAAFMFTLEAME